MGVYVIPMGVYMFLHTLYFPDDVDLDLEMDMEVDLDMEMDVDLEMDVDMSLDVHDKARNNWDYIGNLINIHPNIS